ncbi:MAG: PAS domain S-box protein, partial [Desulfatiglandaceae bacterium]
MDPAKGFDFFKTLMHPDDSYEKEYNALNEPGHDDYSVEFRLKANDGTWRHILSRGKCVKRDDEGKPVRIIGTHTDITELKQAEEALRESEERYRTIFEQAADSIVLIDGETGALVDFNESAHKNLGYTRKEFGRLKISDFEVIETTEEEVLKHLKKVAKLGVDTFETKHRTKAGEIRDIHVSSMAISIHGKRLNQGIWRDITEIKRTHEALQKSERRFRHLVEHAADAFFLHDFNGRIIDVNQHACESLGYTREELLGLSIQDIDLDFFPGKHLEKWKNLVPGEPITFEGAHRRKDGTTFPVEVRLGVFESGERQLMLGLVRDISERKRAEEEKNKLEAQLAQAQRMQALGTIAGGIAHNFNNLLMAVEGNASLMLLETESAHPNHERLENIEKSVQNGSRLTRQLLGYAREGRYEIRPISLNQLVRETSDTFAATRKEITVHRELAKDLWAIKADQGQIEQVLLNLYVNAADAMPGGGDLFLKTTNVTDKDMKDEPYKAKPGNYALLTVTDTGVGMDKKTMERIFDPFFTTKGLAKGTGLGLASVYGTVKAHAGYIDVESKKGHGTTFSIYLPASEKRVEKPVKVDQQIVERTGTILLVDDEELVLDVGVQLLRALGYTVLEAKGGREAVEIYEENKDRIDMVLLDMVMPGMGGGEAYDKMKDINPDIKALLSSGYSIDGQATEILERGCNGFIQKPF